MKTIFTIKGTHCNACKILIEEVCLEFTGINSCLVDFKTGKTIIEHEPTIDFKKLGRELELLGKYKIQF